MQTLPAVVPAPAALDLSPIVAAIQALGEAHMPQPMPAAPAAAGFAPLDLSPIVAAIQAIQWPAQIVNLPAATITPAPNLTINMVVEKAGGNKTGTLIKRADGSFGIEVIAQPET